MKPQIFKILNTDELLSWMLSVLERSNKEFPLLKQAYNQSITILCQELGEERIEKFLNAVNRRCIAEMLFCGNLGYQENLKNFRDPTAQTFMRVDFEEYLRLEILEKMPQRQAAEAEINAFYSSLSEKHKEVYETVDSYLLTLELDIPKLAHYMGFILANELLAYTEVGYMPNSFLTYRYQNFMDQWFGEKVSL